MKIKFNNIRAEIARNRMTMEQFCKKIGIEKKTFYNWESKGDLPASYVLDMAQISGNTTLGTPIPLTEVKLWRHLQPETFIRGLDKPLFAYYRVPGSNTIDDTSPLGVSIFANAITELKAIDVGISRKDDEVEDSRHITFIGQTIKRSADKRSIKLPRFVQELGIGLEDSGNSSIREHTATLLTDERLRDINFNLSKLR